MLSGVQAGMAHGKRDFTADFTAVIQYPIYLDPDKEALYVGNDLKTGGVDFTDPGERSWKDVIVAN